MMLQKAVNKYLKMGCIVVLEKSIELIAIFCVKILLKKSLDVMLK